MYFIAHTVQCLVYICTTMQNYLQYFNAKFGITRISLVALNVFDLVIEKIF